MTEKEFIQEWCNKIKQELKSFPNDFIKGYKTTIFQMPNKSLILGDEIFGGYEILTSVQDVFFQAEDFVTAKYILYANRDLPSKIKIPIQKDDLSAAVENYEKHIDDIFKKVMNEFKSEFPESQKANLVLLEIMKKLNLQRFRKGTI